MKDYFRIGRRDFLRISAAAGFGFVLPAWMTGLAGAALRVGDVPQAVTLIDLTGRKIVIPSDFAGKVLLLHFWASWCPTCRGEMKALEAAYVKYKSRGAVVCSIDLGEKRESVLSYIQNISISYPVLLDPGSSTRKPFGVSGIPTYFLLNREGVIKFKILGEANKDGLDKMVRTLL